MKRLLILLVALNAALIAANIWWGAIHIPAADVWMLLTGSIPDKPQGEAWHLILWQSRIPSALTAALTGAALGVCGLLLQTYFRNPLAGPSVLGITSGANLAVAVVLLTGVTTAVGLTASAIAGAIAVMLLLLALSRLVRHPLTLLIAGVLIGYLVSAIIILLGYYATAEGVQSYMVWGMGSFTGVGLDGLPYYAASLLVAIAASLALAVPLNLWLLGDDYAQSLGVDRRRTGRRVLVITSLLAAVTTAWCGPIAFVGLSVPHLARLALRTDDHRRLLPASALTGAALTSVCQLLSTLPPSGRLLPVNALTPIFGVPVILWVLLRRRA